MSTTLFYRLVLAYGGGLAGAFLAISHGFDWRWLISAALSVAVGVLAGRVPKWGQERQ